MQPRTDTQKRQPRLANADQRLRLLSQALNGDAWGLATDALPQFCDTTAFEDCLHDAFHILSTRGKQT